MKHRTLYTKTCPCGQRFTTSDKDSQYCHKRCAARFRPVYYGPRIKPSVEALKAFAA